MEKFSYTLIALFFILTSCNFAPGSYPYAEIYELEVSEDKIIEAVKKFKIENNEFCVPENVGLIDGRSKDKNDHWYHIWFYSKKENQIIYTWIRGNKLAFISVNASLELGNWKRINKDFSRKENKAQIAKFEKLILNKILIYIK